MTAPSRLILLPRHSLAVDRHAAAAYPEECCGVLVGRPLAEGAGAGRLETLVERILPVDNERQDSRENRYLIHPETVLAAEKEARRIDRQVVGYYHSHPDHPARPSEFDREHAWPGLSYVIVSVTEGSAAETRSWRLDDDRSRFLEEELTHVIPVPVAHRRSDGG